MEPQARSEVRQRPKLQKNARKPNGGRKKDQSGEARPTDQSPTIFFCYRRKDDPAIARLLFERLKGAFGKGRVFKDRDMRPGIIFPAEILKQINKCWVFLAVIGPRWLNAGNEAVESRLDNPSDWVRIEIETALNLKKCIIPVLISDAAMPDAEHLPETLKALPTYTGLSVTHDDPHFDDDARRLIKAIKKEIERIKEAQAEETARQERERLEVRARTEKLLKAEEERRGAAERTAWSAIKDSTDPAAIESFLKKHPNGAHAVEARARLDYLCKELAAWSAVKDTAEPAALVSFLEKFPEGPHAVEARKRLHELRKSDREKWNAVRQQKELAAWNAVKETADIAALVSFLQKFPDGAHAAEARERLDYLRKELAAWNAVKDTIDTAALESFLKKFPDGPHAVEARAQLDYLSKELAAWSAVKDTAEPAALVSFLEKFPEGPHAAAALSRLRWLARAQPDKLPEAPGWEKEPDPTIGGTTSRAILIIVVATVFAIAGAARYAFYSEPPQNTPQDLADPQREEQPVAANGHEQVPIPSPKPRGESWSDTPGKEFKDCDICPEMVVVPAGTFKMGSLSGEKDSKNEAPQHEVEIDAPFAVGKYEVTFDEWDACVAAGGCNGHRPNDEGWGRERHPVINVSWKDAKAYVAWLSEKTGKDYRLPSDAEWEYAARGGTSGPFWWGDTIKPAKANYGGSQTSRASPPQRRRPFQFLRPPEPENVKNQSKTVLVDTFDPNPFGLYNVHGNVWEWVEDCWNPNDDDGPPSDGSAWTSGSDCGVRVLRSGSWASPPNDLRSANRTQGLGAVRNIYVGFRVARSLP